MTLVSIETFEGTKINLVASYFLPEKFLAFFNFAVDIFVNMRLILSILWLSRLGLLMKVATSCYTSFHFVIIILSLLALLVYLNFLLVYLKHRVGLLAPENVHVLYYR